MANVGVHGKPVELHLQDLWIQNITISMGLVNANTHPDAAQARGTEQIYR